MSAFEVTTRERNAGDRLNGWLLASAATLMLVLVAGRIQQLSSVRADLSALESSGAWRQGGWLSQLVINFVGLLPGERLRQVALALISAVVAGGLLSLFTARLRRTSWDAWTTVLSVGGLAGNILVLYTVTAASPVLPLSLSLAVLVPGIYAFERNRDVQSIISLGLSLPLLLLASPVTAPLVIPLGVGIALATPDGRSDPRAFVAMALVVLLPSLIVAVGIIGFASQNGIGAADLLLPYIMAFRPGPGMDWKQSLDWVVPMAPLIALLALRATSAAAGGPGWTGVAVLILPAYLTAGAALWSWALPIWAPALVALTMFAAWLAVVPTSRRLRVAAALCLCLSALLGWTFGTAPVDTNWRFALAHIAAGLPGQ